MLYTKMNSREIAPLIIYHPIVVFQVNHMGSVAAGVLGGAGGLLAVVVLLVVFLVVFRLQRKKRKE